MGQAQTAAHHACQCEYTDVHSNASTQLQAAAVTRVMCSTIIRMGAAGGEDMMDRERLVGCAMRVSMAEEFQQLATIPRCIVRMELCHDVRARLGTRDGWERAEARTVDTASMTNQLNNTLYLWPSSSLTAHNAPSLLPLQNASKPAEIEQLLIDVFRRRHDGLSAEYVKGVQQAFGIATSEDTQALLISVAHLLHHSLSGPISKESIVSWFPQDFHAQLRTLLVKLIGAHIHEWRDATLQQLIGPAQLVDFSWRVDMKASSNSVARIHQPTVFVDMALQPPACNAQHVPATKDVTFEMSAEALQTLLNGLEKIQNQLGNMK